MSIEEARFYSKNKNRSRKNQHGVIIIKIVTSGVDRLQAIKEITETSVIPVISDSLKHEEIVDIFVR